MAENPIRLSTFAAVREISWLVYGGFGLSRRGEIRHLRHMVHLIAVDPAQIDWMRAFKKNITFLGLCRFKTMQWQNYLTQKAELCVAS